MNEKSVITVKCSVSKLFILKILLFVGIFSFLFLPSAQALNIPNLQGYVNDYANMITPSVKSELENKLRALEKTDSTQIVILAIPSLDGENIKELSLKVANTWGIGQRGKNNGILFFVSKKDRQMRIEIGKGLEGRLPNPAVEKIIAQVIRPKFANGDWDGGFIAGATALIDATKGAYTAEVPRRPVALHAADSKTTRITVVAGANGGCGMHGGSFDAMYKGKKITIEFGFHPNEANPIPDMYSLKVYSVNKEVEDYELDEFVCPIHPGKEPKNLAITGTKVEMVGEWTSKEKFSAYKIYVNK